MKSLRYQRDYENPSIEERQTTKWTKEKGQKLKQGSLVILEIIIVY
jgi:hypothetical protein